jgi:hypothetical protein
MFVRGALLASAAGAALVAAPAFSQDAGGAGAGDEAEGNHAIVVLGARLEESTPQELEKYGSRLEVIEGETIDRAGFTDTSQALQMLVPGLYLAPQSGAFDYVNMSLLGSRQSDILVLVDGVRISNRLYAATSPFETVPAHMIFNGQEVTLKGGNPVFKNLDKETVAVSWPLSQGGVLQVTLKEKTVSMKLTGTRSLNWYLDLETAPGARLPFTNISARQVDGNVETFNYHVSARKGRFSKPSNGAVFRLQPENNEIRLNL